MNTSAISRLMPKLVAAARKDVIDGAGVNVAVAIQQYQQREPDVTFGMTKVKLAAPKQWILRVKLEPGGAL